jgi:hypothetical protein
MEKDYESTGHYDPIKNSFKRYEAVCGSHHLPLKFNAELSKIPMFNFDTHLVDLKPVSSGTDWSAFDIDKNVSATTLKQIPSYDPTPSFDHNRDGVGRDIYLGTDANDPLSVDLNYRCKLEGINDLGYVSIQCPRAYPSGAIHSGTPVFFTAASDSAKIGSFGRSGKPTVVGLVTVVRTGEDSTYLLAETLLPTKSQAQKMSTEASANR